MPRHPFYNSAAWKKIRLAKLARNPLCEKCLCIKATDVDHICSIRTGGDPLAWDNLQSLCHACHSAKTFFIERMGKDRVPVKGCRADGTPLDPLHHWNKDTSMQGHAEIVPPDANKRVSRPAAGKKLAIAECLRSGARSKTELVRGIF
jgi:5-methylcytosine-specific restriction enzyme A